MTNCVTRQSVCLEKICRSFESKGKSAAKKSVSTETESSGLDIKKRITTPFGWRRELVNGNIVYFTPNNQSLSSLNEITKYLQSDGTCKCGLECPINIEETFNFGTSVDSLPYDIELSLNDKATKLCNHKRKNVALARYQHSAALYAKVTQNKTETNADDEIANCTESETESNLQKCCKTDDLTKTKVPELSVSVICDPSESTSSYTPSTTPSNESPNSQNTFEMTCDTPISHPNEFGIDQNFAVSKELSVAETNQDFDTLNHISNHCQPCLPNDLYNCPSICIYENGHTSGVYSLSPNGSHLPVQEKNCNAIYFSHQSNCPVLPTRFHDSNISFLQHNSGFRSDAFNFNQSNNAHGIVQTAIATIPLNSPSQLISLQSGANTDSTGAVAFHSTQIASNSICLNEAYSSASHNHQAQSNIPMLSSQNSSMPPLSVSNVTNVTTSVSEMIPAVGLTSQFVNGNANNTSPQVVHFINSVPLAPLSTNAVTVLQQNPAADPSRATLLIPQIVQPETSMLLGSSLGTQSATVFPHIATANLTSLQNFLGTSHMSSVTPNALQSFESSKPRQRRKKDYGRTHRSHPPTVASILKQVEAKEKKQLELKKQMETLDNSETLSKKRNRSVAVQSDNLSDNESTDDVNIEAAETADPNLSQFQESCEAHRVFAY